MYGLDCDCCHARIVLPELGDNHDLALGILYMGGWRWTANMISVECPTCRHWIIRRQLTKRPQPPPTPQHQVM